MNFCSLFNCIFLEMAQSPLCKSIAQAVSASLTAEASVVTQSNLPKPRQTRKLAGAVPAADSTPERAVTAYAPHISTTGVAVHNIVKAVMVEMCPHQGRSRDRRRSYAAQLEASIAAGNERLSNEVGHLRSALQSQAFDRLAQYSSRENVRLHGVPETADENANDVVIAIASDMGVHIDERDICISHRLQKSRSMKERPTIVEVCASRHEYSPHEEEGGPHQQHVVNDDLAPLRSKMLRALNLDDQVKRVWTIDGSFHCIVMKRNVDGKKRLDSPDDLFKLGWSEDKMENSSLFSHH